MSESKVKTLLSRLSLQMNDSIGVRAGEPTQPDAGDTGPAPIGDYTRHREAAWIDLASIVPDPEQPRKEFDEEELRQLADSIKKDGQLQPIRVRWDASLDGGRWVIIAGERRYRAATLAGLDKMSCIIVQGEITKERIRSEQLLENLLREDLRPIESAHAFRELMELHGWTAKRLATELHLSTTKVSNILSLLKLPDDLQRKVEDGALPPSTAYELAKIKDQDAQRALADKALSGQVKHVETARAAKRAAPASGPKRRSTNETFRVMGNIKITVTSRSHVGNAGVLQALLEAVELIRRRDQAGQQQAA
jgi:ParB family chromosome partitioning protein